jgi:hypothetical protein
MKKDFRISSQNVKSLSDEELFWAVIEPIWPASEDDTKDELKHISDGTPGQRAIYTTTLFIREVNNGGLHQFFSNSSGIYAKEVLKGFELLGVDKHACILKKAFEFFPDGKVPLDRELRQSCLQKRKNDIKTFFDPLDDELFGEERLYPYFRKYIDSHPHDFFNDQEN